MASNIIGEITATEDTYLKRSCKPASDLPADEKRFVPKGKKFFLTDACECTEKKDWYRTTKVSNGHYGVSLGYGAGDWMIYGNHWQLPWQVVVTAPKSELVQPEWNEVDWNDFAAPLSRYFTVGEVTNMSRERIPRADGNWSEKQIKQNIIRMARQMDEIREWWGHPIGVNSWLRPWKINFSIGSKSKNHPSGMGVDFRPLGGGNVWELQKRFQREWYNTGKWQHGMGLGAGRGFVHLDLYGRRCWNY